MATLNSSQRNCTFQPIHSLKYQTVLDAHEIAADSPSHSLGAHQGPLVKVEKTVLECFSWAQDRAQWD